MKTITDEELKALGEMYGGTNMAWKYWPAFCQQCGWKGLSGSCVEQGHSKSIVCPKCYFEVQDISHLTGDLRYYKDK